MRTSLLLGLCFFLVNGDDKLKSKFCAQIGARNTVSCIYDTEIIDEEPEIVLCLGDVSKLFGILSRYDSTFCQSFGTMSRATLKNVLAQTVFPFLLKKSLLCGR